MFLKFGYGGRDARNTGKEAAVATRINGNQIGISAYQKQASEIKTLRASFHLVWNLCRLLGNLLSWL